MSNLDESSPDTGVILPLDVRAVIVVTYEL